MGRYLKLAILTAGLWTYAAAAMADDPSASTQSPPAAATATHAMATSTAQAASTVSQPEAATATSAAPAATTDTDKTVPTPSEAPTTAVMPVQSNSGPSMPIRGMSMENVEHIFGAPQEKLPAVPDPGNKLHPPITRWVYPNYVVYFEYNVVIHTVLKDHPFNSDSSNN